MKKDSKLVVFTILFCFLVLLFSINFVSIKADSGWDSSFDSDWGSSSWDSGSDWGSSWDSGSDWGSSYSSSSSDGSFLFFLIIVIIIIIVVSKNNKMSSGKSRIVMPNRYLDMNAQALLAIKEKIPEFNNEEFCTNVVHTFIDVQNAWTNFDYDKLRELLTDELYNTYHMQLKALHAKKQKNIMDSFTRINCLIVGFEENKDGNYTFKCVLQIAFHDYVATMKDNVLRGDKVHRIEMLYELTFIGSLDDLVNKCPNCNAPLPDSASNVCPYCNSTVVSTKHKLVMSKKQAIKQGWYD